MSTFGPYPGVIQEVHDGDTVKVRLDLGFALTFFISVRVYGINAPELSTSEGKAARDFAKEILPVGSQCSVISHGWDKYGGRIDGEIHFADAVGEIHDLGEVMIQSGHAVEYNA